MSSWELLNMHIIFQCFRRCEYTTNISPYLQFQIINKMALILSLETNIKKRIIH